MIRYVTLTAFASAGKND